MLALLAAAVLAPQDTRPFRMGFTPWPSEMSAAGLKAASDFMKASGDLDSIMVLGGVPWPEALSEKPFSTDLNALLTHRPPANSKLFLSLSPLAMDRKSLAPYHGARPDMPLPPEFQGLPFDHEKVLKAYTRFVLRAVETAKPDYLAIGVESNVLLSTDAKAWPAYKRLHRAVFEAVKKKRPRLPVFFTTEVNHYLGRSENSDAAKQAREVQDLMKWSDYFAMSYYPHMTFQTQWPIPKDVFSFAQKFRKKVAVSETGMSSQPVPFPGFALPGSPELQLQYYQVLLQAAKENRFEFVVTFCTTDYERLLAVLPPESRSLASIWTYTGLQTSAGALKPAGQLWRSVFSLTYRTTKTVTRRTSPVRPRIAAVSPSVSSLDRVPSALSTSTEAVSARTQQTGTWQ